MNCTIFMVASFLYFFTALDFENALSRELWLLNYFKKLILKDLAVFSDIIKRWVVFDPEQCSERKKRTISDENGDQNHYFVVDGKQLSIGHRTWHML